MINKIKKLYKRYSGLIKIAGIIAAIIIGLSFFFDIIKVLITAGVIIGIIVLAMRAIQKQNQENSKLRKDK